MIYSMNQSFILSSNCSYISSHRCSVKLVFWYERRNYVVRFPGDLLNDDNIDDNRHFMMIEVAMNTFFSYDINHVCKDKDDCARYYAEKKINEMTQRSFNISNIYNDLERILYRNKSFNDHDLLCFDSNEDIRQCTIARMIGSCQIIDDLIKYKTHRRICQRHSQESASVNIYDSNSFALMTIKCNRMLCNGPLTIQAVKNVLNHHHITNIHGRLSANSSRISIKYYLFIFLFFVIFSN
ncbi:unnamed protein product [Rotaria sp. Silwood1]|nr:unnamed protein product [Rotaria sp. Silwood1]CAF1631982.1 unnamed protein product [Rotaria sp. Silwood1]CAF3742541.1 unnamed protein product [Rotaria sp. Silwood1]CAF3759076.1 unnamed protein product [Rotaria sp. Silwood1]CAF3785853.1 unnamed protein product [Rotaria sp. Silwood1]